ncbi:MAG: L-threonylcarbamoyladenylate synthase [Patescibacteria group bacterium]
MLKEGCVGVVPTDTVYGLIARALDISAVERIYQLKNRTANKPLIILINGIETIRGFGIEITAVEHAVLERIWPGPITVIFPNPVAPIFSYLHRGGSKLAFRWPASKLLIDLIRENGPLVAPSANPEGEPPAITITEAKKYFGDQVDFYEPGGHRIGSPSTLVELVGTRLKIIRPGAGVVPPDLIYVEV